MPISTSPVTRMHRSGIRTLMELAMRDPEAIRLEIGEPDVPTPAHVVAAAGRDAAAGHTAYTSSTGTPELRAALAEKVRRVNGLDVTASDVVVTHGAMHGLAMAINALAGPGDEVLLPDPEFPNWRMAAVAAGVGVATYPAHAANGFVPTLEDIAAAITPATRVIVVCSPNNPTGAMYPPELLAGVVELARERDLWVFSDECYEAITFDRPHASPAAFDTDGRVLTFFSFSKTYAMTGWRLGYVVSRDPGVIDLLGQVAEATVACPSSVSQRAALAALTGPQDDVAAAVDSYRERRDAAVALLDARGIPSVRPQGAFYLMVDVSAAMADSEAFALRLLADRHVSVSPGSAFGPGGEGMVRVSLAAERGALLDGLSLLADAVADWSATAATGARAGAAVGGGALHGAADS
ncbi:pyridoxal phosphate-dependent aminotransferase [Cellulosimicrobium cellulans]|uniref:pyridoxal phosphate-dependent aminotransferase n=1 Tax=Cellulosimicrobium cellulans TaxID=1710 RepID=UPI0021CB4AC6|nr:pyridoxal phosphate-dependent aminotransferase [Cellulosimicrobium cellulans]